MPYTEVDIPRGGDAVLTLPDGSAVRIVWGNHHADAEWPTAGAIRVGIDAPRHIGIVRDEIEHLYPRRKATAPIRPNVRGWDRVRLARAGRLK